jgi:hypothetical protein
MSNSKIILPVLFGLVLLGISGLTNNVFGEIEEDEEFITADFDEIIKPQSVSKYQEITLIGHVNGYSRGDNISLLIINPDGTEEEMSTYASKKGNVYTLLHMTEKSQIGVYEIIMIYDDIERASTTFKMIEGS